MARALAELPESRRGRPRHAVTVRIDEAISKLERYGVAVTPTAVKTEVEKTLTHADFTPDTAICEALNARVVRRMKETGKIITGDVVNGSRVRKDFWNSNLAELEEQQRIKLESSQFDRARIACDEAVIAFLREQQDTFGYEVYPGLFHAEIDRIYAMHGLPSPTA